MSTVLRDRIWITSRVRMKSESRLRQANRYWTFVTFWYSTVLTCLTVYQLVAEKDPARDIISATLAILLLALSIYLPSLNLEQQADRYRECYLKLQSLRDTVKDDKALTREYYEVLQSYPNHPSSDYDDFVVSALLAGQSVFNGESEVKPTFSMHVGFWLRKAVRASSGVLIILAPILLYFVL